LRITNEKLEITGYFMFITIPV